MKPDAAAIHWLNVIGLILFLIAEFIAVASALNGVWVSAVLSAAACVFALYMWLSPVRKQGRAGGSENG